MKAELVEKLDELEKLVKRMDVPEFKVRNVGWLNRNLAIRNKDAKGFERANELIVELLKNGISNG